MDPVITGSLVSAGTQLVTTWLRNRSQSKAAEKAADFERWLHQDEKQFQKEQFEAEKQFQREMALERYQEQLSLAVVHRSTALDSVEWRAALENFPLRILPSQILESYSRYTSRDTPMPLLVLLAPPEVSFDRFLDRSSTLPFSERTIAEVVRRFVACYEDLQHPIKFLAGGWDSKRYHGEAAFETLFALLGSVPTLIVESEIDGRYFNLRAAFWDIGQTEPAVSSVISHLDCQKLLNEAARADARQWAADRERYAARGRGEEEILQIGGDDERNLRTLREEELDRDAGILRARSYAIGDKQWERLFQQIGGAYALIVGCLTDVYHLQNRGVMPRLPAMLPNWEGGGLLNADVARFLASCYELVFKSLGEQIPNWMPDLYLNVAIGFAGLPEASETSRFLRNALEHWLRLRGFTIDEEDDLVSLVLANAGVKDRPWLRGVRGCLEAIGDHSQAVEIEGRLDEWQNKLLTGGIEEDERGEVLVTF